MNGEERVFSDPHGFLKNVSCPYKREVALKMLMAVGGAANANFLGEIMRSPDSDYRARYLAAVHYYSYVSTAPRDQNFSDAILNYAKQPFNSLEDFLVVVKKLNQETSMFLGKILLDPKTTFNARCGVASKLCQLELGKDQANEWGLELCFSIQYKGNYGALRCGITLLAYSEHALPEEIKKLLDDPTDAELKGNEIDNLIELRKELFGESGVSPPS